MEIVIQVNGEPDLTAIVGGELAFYNPETDEYETRGKTLGDLVAEKLADKIYSMYAHEDIRELRNQIARDREKLIRERLEPILSKAMSGEIYATNGYGERIGGKPITIRELIVSEAGKALTTRSRYDQKPTVLEQAVSKEVNAVLTKELNEAVGAAKAELVKAVRDKAAQFMTDEVLRRKMI